MKKKWINKVITYDGSQLRPLFAYENYNLLGESIISWVGPCDIPFENMKDLEDVNAHSPIRGSQMLHFIIEIFHQSLFSGVSLQRLFASIIKDQIQTYLIKKRSQVVLLRSGDDLYFNDQKLSISIAAQGVISTQIHFALNISNKGTPVRTLSLQDLGINPKDLASNVMTVFCKEFISIIEATKKVRTN